MKVSATAKRRLLWAAHAIAAACLLDALLEPYLLVVSVHARPAPFARLRVAHLSDLHTHGFGLRERRLVSAVAAARPDLVAITGDTVDEGDLEVARPVLTALAATKPKLGLFAVDGNWEHWRPVAGRRASRGSDRCGSRPGRAGSTAASTKAGPPCTSARAPGRRSCGCGSHVCPRSPSSTSGTRLRRP